MEAEVRSVCPQALRQDEGAAEARPADARDEDRLLPPGLVLPDRQDAVESRGLRRGQGRHSAHAEGRQSADSDPAQSKLQADCRGGLLFHEDPDYVAAQVGAKVVKIPHHVNAMPKCGTYVEFLDTLVKTIIKAAPDDVKKGD